MILFQKLKDYLKVTGDVYYLEDRYAAVQIDTWKGNYYILTSTQDSLVFPSDILLCPETTIDKYDIFMRGIFIAMRGKGLRSLEKIGSIPVRYRPFFSGMASGPWDRTDSEWLYLCRVWENWK